MFIQGMDLNKEGFSCNCKMFKKFAPLNSCEGDFERNILPYMVLIYDFFHLTGLGVVLLGYRIRF